MNSRRRLRGEMLGTLLLADINVRRDDLVLKVGRFNGEKLDIIKNLKGLKRQKETKKGKEVEDVRAAQKTEQDAKGKKEPNIAAKGAKRAADDAGKGDDVIPTISYKRSKIVFKKNVKK